MPNWKQLKRLIKNPLLEIRWLFRRLIILENHKNIIKLARKNKKIKIESKMFGPGNIEHYYHFIFDLLLPINFIIEKTSWKNIFLIKKFGILTEILINLFHDNIKILGQKEFFSKEIIPSTKIIGIDPGHTIITNKDCEQLKKNILNKLNIKNCENPKKILLIERGTPLSYYINEAELKWSGNSRRSIINHSELRKMLGWLIKPDFEFINLELEKLSFKEQIEHFNSAIIVIGQHGAGLSNILWMNKGWFVIEFWSENMFHYKKLSRAKDLKYFLQSHKEQHIKIDCENLKKWLIKNPLLKNFF